MATSLQSPREQRFARALDREVAPLWHDRFARMVYRHLPQGIDAFTLDVHCGPGRTTAELLERLGEGSRVLALEPDPSLRRLAKAKMRTEWKGRVYLKDGDLSDIVSMGSDTYDLVLANLVLGEVQGFEESLREIVRVTKPSGHVFATLPMAGTWAEVEDLFREVLVGASLPDAARRLRHLAQLRPKGHDLARSINKLGVGPNHYVVEQERSALLFASGREFLFSPVIEHGPLRQWKAILGAHDKPQELFWALKETIDTYYAESVFAVSVMLGLIHIRVPEPGAGRAHTAAETAGEYWRQYPELDQLFGRSELRDDEDIDIDLELEDEEQRQSPVPTEIAAASPMSAEDQAIFASLDQPATPQEDNSALDELLDQVLEFARPQEEIEEIEDLELEDLIPSEEVQRPRETLKRLRALMPPPPAIPPPRRKKDPRGGQGE